MKNHTYIKVENTPVPSVPMVINYLLLSALLFGTSVTMLMGGGAEMWVEKDKRREKREKVLARRTAVGDGDASSGTAGNGGDGTAGERRRC